MPSLIRLLVVLIFLGLIVFGVMVALTVFVDPGEREMTVRIPTRDIFSPDQQQPLSPDQLRP